MGKENEKTDNLFEGFSILNADVIPANLEVENVELDEHLGVDTGIVELTPEEIEAQNKEAIKNKEASKSKKEEVAVEEEEETTEDDEESPIKVIATHLGEKGIIDIEDFEDSEEGLEKAVEKRIEKEVESYKKSLGDISQKFIEFVENGGDPRKFIEAYAAPDFSAITDKQLENENVQEHIVRELLQLEGYSLEEIEEEITEYKEGGILENKAKRAKSKLVRYEEARKQQLVEQQKEANKAQIKQREEYIEAIKATIDSKEEIAGFQIKEREKKDFFEYFTSADKKTGKTKLIEDMEKDPEIHLKMAWLLYNKFDFKKLEKKVEKKVVSDLAAKLKNATRPGGGSKPKETNDFSGFGKAL